MRNRWLRLCGSWAWMVALVGVIRGQEVVLSWVASLDVYEQESTATPIYRGSAFLASMILSEPTHPFPAGAMTITFPDGSTFDLAVSALDPQLGFSSWIFASRAERDAFATNGNYRFNYSGGGGYQLTVVRSAGADPPLPRVTNFTALQNLTSGPGVDVQWAPESGAFLESDFVLLGTTDEAENDIFNSAELWEDGVLTGLDNHLEVLVPPGKTSTGTLMMLRATNMVMAGDRLSGAAAAGIGVVFPIRSLLPADLEAPHVVGSIPAEGAYAVDPETPIVLTFNEPMLLRGGLTAPGVPLLDDTLVTWSTDRRTATVVPPSPLPAGPVTVFHDGGEDYIRLFADLSANVLPPASPVVSFFVGRQPMFTNQPDALTNVAWDGEAVELDAGVLWPGETLNFQWERNGVPIPGAVNKTCRIESFGVPDEGIYQLVVTNEFGEVRSRRALVMMNQLHLVPHNADIVLPYAPSGQGLRIAPGLPLKLELWNVNGSPPYAYQWRRDGEAIAGETIATLAISSLSLDDAGVYDVLVTNAYGEGVSNAVTVDVTTDLPLPAMETAQARIPAAVGERVFLPPVIFEQIPTLVLQWRLDGTVIPGADQLFLEIPSFAASQYGVYTFVLSNGAQEAVLANYDVVPRDSSFPVLGIPPYLTADQEVVVSENRIGTLEVLVDGAAPLALQWTKDGQALPGAVESKLDIPSGDPAVAGVYTLIATNAYGSAESGVFTVRFVSVNDLPSKPWISASYGSPGGKTGTAILEGKDLRLFAYSEWSPAEITSWEWRRNGVPFTTAWDTYFFVSGVGEVDAGTYTVACGNSHGTIESDPFVVSVVSPGDPPLRSADPVTRSEYAGNSIELPCPVVFPPGSQLRWFVNDTEITGDVQFSAFFGTVEIPCLQRWHEGNVWVQVSNAAGTVSASAAELTILDGGDTSSGHLVNVSTRAVLGQGAQTLIGGFAIEGSATKRLLIRGVGAGLTPMVGGVAAGDARLTIYRQSIPIAANEDWIDTADPSGLFHAQVEAGAFFVDPEDGDAGLIFDATPGAYTVHVRTDPGHSGVGLVEIYDLDPGYPVSRIVNLSSRVFVGTGDELSIPGLVVAGTTPRQFLVRAVGPGLAQYNVVGYLADPRFRINQSSVGDILHNDDWGNQPDPSAVAAAANLTGAFELQSGSKDAAMLVTLRPGVYSVLVSGAGDTTGVALVEVYEVP